MEELKSPADVNRGDLEYTLSVTPEKLGGQTDVSITQSHDFDKIAPT